MNKNRYVLGAVAGVLAIVLGVVLLTNQTQPTSTPQDQNAVDSGDSSSIELTRLVTVTVDINGDRNEYSYSIESSDKLINIIDRIDAENEDFSIGYKEFDFGKMVETINGYTVQGNEFWNIKVNGEDAQLGISDLEVNRGDGVEFSISTF